MKTVSIFHSSRVLVAAGLLALSSLAVSCKDNDDAYDLPSFSIASTTIEEPKEGQEIKVNFETNRNWTVSTQATWISVTPAQGKPGEGFTIKALENTGAERSATLTLKYGSKETTLTVKQAAGQSSTVQPQPTQGMSLSDFITKYDKGSEVTISDDDTFQAVVLSDTQANNVVRLKNITVQSGNVGISVSLKENNKFKPGEVLTFKTKGAKVLRFNGSLQIDYSALKEQTIESTGTTQTITPIKATLSDIYAGKYENVLVTVEGVQFTKSGVALNAGTKTGWHSLTDCATSAPTGIAPLSVAISSHFPQKAELTSDKNGSITGILLKAVNQQGRTNYNLWIRNLADMNLSAQACTATTTPTQPTAPTTPVQPVTPSQPSRPTTPAVTPSGSDLFISAYVEGSAYEKYIQIYNPTANAIDLSGYKIVIQSYNPKNQLVSGNDHESSLTGTLAPGAVLVLKHKDAKKFAGDATVNGVIRFSGNDNFFLYKGATLIDVIGTPGAAWLDGKKSVGADVTLHRKASINKGNATYTAAEWDVLAKDDVSVLGKR